MENKKALSKFLNLTSSYLAGGYRKFDDPINELNEIIDGESDLPLAYLIDEEDFTLDKIYEEIDECRNCPLYETRNKAVPGEGVLNPRVMVIGEGPGADEDRDGRPFVGRAGQLLDKMLSSIGLSREENTYIANIVKCRPPLNRDPGPEEISACIPYLITQIKLLKPKIILCAGRVAAQAVLGTSRGLNSIRGLFHNYCPDGDEENPIPLLASFHPSAILRDDQLRRPAWEDLKLLKSHLDSL